MNPGISVGRRTSKGQNWPSSRQDTPTPGRPDRHGQMRLDRLATIASGLLATITPEHLDSSRPGSIADHARTSPLRTTDGILANHTSGGRWRIHEPRRSFHSPTRRSPPDPAVATLAAQPIPLPPELSSGKAVGSENAFWQHRTPTSLVRSSRAGSACMKDGRRNWGSSVSNEPPFKTRAYG